ncbi:MAG: hypothetical protein ACRCYO_03390, partial [Bacteroidia bacterium]
IRFVEFRPAPECPLILQKLFTPVTTMALLAYPLTDTLRVFIYRAMKGVSPLSADRNHLHHLLIDSGFSHRKTVISIYTATLFVFGVAFACRNMPTTAGFFITGGTVILLMLLPILIRSNHRKKNPVVVPPVTPNESL